ncbi:MAG: patatin-like phospholipase family protein [Gammaproteobacteria bacterium]
MSHPKTSRRELLRGAGALALAAAAPKLQAAGPERNTPPRIGIALGAGGANGLAHIPMLEVLDELGIRPHRIAGSSIGAVIGALYASGMSATAIRELVRRDFSPKGSDTLERLISEQALTWMELVEVELGDGGLLDSETVLSHFYESIGERSFENLELPFVAVAADLWNREQVILDRGPVERAVRASMALPGVFEPVLVDGRVLIDGGTVNPVPWDLLDDCDWVIAVDVSGVRSRPDNGAPGYFEVLFNSAKVMQGAIVDARREHAPPDLFLAPEIRDIRALEFYRADEVFTMAQPSRDRLRRELEALLRHEA